jgi:hypothetical protein
MVRQRERRLPFCPGRVQYRYASRLEYISVEAG